MRTEWTDSPHRRAGEASQISANGEETSCNAYALWGSLERSDPWSLRGVILSLTRWAQSSVPPSAANVGPIRWPDLTALGGSPYLAVLTDTKSD